MFLHCFRNDHVGHARATATSHTYEKKIKIPVIFFRFCFGNPFLKNTSLKKFFGRGESASTFNKSADRWRFLLHRAPGRPTPCGFVTTALAQKLVCDVCCQKCFFFILPFPCVLMAFSEGLSVRELRTQSQNEEAQKELGWELTVDF